MTKLVRLYLHEEGTEGNSGPNESWHNDIKSSHAGWCMWHVQKDSVEAMRALSTIGAKLRTGCNATLQSMVKNCFLGQVKLVDGLASWSRKQPANPKDNKISQPNESGWIVNDDVTK